MTPLRGHDLVQEAHEFVAGVPLRRFTQDGPGLGFQGRIQRERAMADVLEPVSLRAARGERQNGVASIESLNRGLFIDTEHSRMLRRIQVQPDDFGRLLLEVRIRRSEIAFQAVGLQAGPLPRTRDNRVRDVELVGQAPRGPMGRAVGRRLPCPVQDPRLQLWRQHARFRAAMATTQAGHTVGEIPRFPRGDRLRGAVDPLADGRVRVAVSQQQDDSCASRFVGTPTMRTGQCLKRDP